MFTKFGRDEVFMALHMHQDVSTISAQGGSRVRQKQVKGGVGGNLAYNRSAYCTQVIAP